MENAFGLPHYSYFPNGPWPHPVSDPLGHSRGQRPSALRDKEALQQGVALFNRGYYWEAHEVWEAGWASLGRSGAAADYFKGLVHLAAAGVKVREGVPAGVTNHVARAAELLRWEENEAVGAMVTGLSLKAVATALLECLSQPRPRPDLPVAILTPPLVISA